MVEERRVLTVLFGDLVGFTSLSEHLDPEQVKRLVDACFQLLVEDINVFGGTVDKIVGDGIVALFGVPVAHEDDAERAVRAGLRMQDTLANFAAARMSSIRKQGDSPLQMRIGINTGVALVGTVAGSDYTAMGDVVNTAARLQTLAPPGRVLVGETTHGLTESSITYESVGDLSARGRENVVPAWLAVCAVAQPGTRRRRRDVAIMGRSTELALALASLDFSIGNSQAALLAVDGEGGVGKSRLVDELIDVVRMRQATMVLQGSAVPYGEANVWWPLAHALFDKLDLDPNAPPDAVHAVALENGRGLFADADEPTLKQLTDAFQHLLGHPSKLDELEPAATREAITRAVTMVLERRLRDGPVLLSITDVHWADAVVLDLCEHLLIALARMPFMLVTTNRPDADLVWPPLSTRAAVVRLPLEPLGPIAAAQLCRAILGADADEDTIAKIYDRSGGNPLFLEELAVLVAEGGDVTALPDSLRAVIAARLDQLAPDQRAVLDNAAVLGPSGQVDNLEAFAHELNQAFSMSIIDDLVDAGLLELDGKRWTFNSDSVREVAYNTLTKARRATRHMGLARAMQQSNANADDLSHHLASVAEIVAELGPIPEVPDDICDQAITALEEAGRRASHLGNLRQVVRCTSRALELFGFGELAPELLQRRARLRLRRIGAYVALRQLDLARPDTEAVLAEALDTGDLDIQARALRARGLISQAAGDLPLARTQLGEAIDLFRELDDRLQLAETLRMRGALELFGGSLTDAEWLFGEAAGLFSELDDRRGLGYIEQHRAWMSFLAGNIAVAEKNLQRAAATLTELGDRAGVGWATGLLAYVEFFKRRFKEAEELATQVLVEAKERGDDWSESRMFSLTAAIRMWTGHTDAAARLAEQARIKFSRLGDAFGLSHALSVLGRSQVALGDANAAQTSEALLAQGDFQGRPPFPYVAAAGIAMHAGESKTAVLLAEEAVERFVAIRANAGEAWIIKAMGLVQSGQIDAAREALAHVDEALVVHPFYYSTSAIVAAISHNFDASIAAAEEVAAATGHTYLDGVIASIAAGASAAATGDAEAGERWLEGAAAQAAATEDIVANAIALSAFEHVLGRQHPAGTAQVDSLGLGWRALIETLPRLINVG